MDGPDVQAAAAYGCTAEYLRDAAATELALFFPESGRDVAGSPVRRAQSVQIVARCVLLGARSHAWCAQMQAHLQPAVKSCWQGLLQRIASAGPCTLLTSCPACPCLPRWAT